MLKKNIGKSLSQMVRDNLDATGFYSGDNYASLIDVVDQLSVEDVLHALINETDIEEVEYIFNELKERNNEFG